MIASKDNSKWAGGKRGKKMLARDSSPCPSVKLNEVKKKKIKKKQ